MTCSGVYALPVFSNSTFIPLTSALAAGGVEDVFRNYESMRVGIYLRLPLNSGLRRAPDNGYLGYGLELGFERNVRTS